MTIIAWKEPPSNGRKRRGENSAKHEANALELQRHPGEWAILDMVVQPDHKAISRLRSHASHIRSGFLAAYQPKHAFDAVVRTDADGSAAVYARYLGTPEVPASSIEVERADT